jgi:hypothetical protein
MPASGTSTVRRVPITRSLESLSERIGRCGIDAGGATIARLREALSSGSLTSAELTAFYLERIGRFNPDLRAVITVSPAAAQHAAASDARRAGGGAPGPLEGIPVLVKDNIAVARMPATAGSPALADTEAGDAFCVAGRGHPRQGQSLGMGEHPVREFQQRLEHPGRPGGEPARRRPQSVGLQLGLCCRGRRGPGPAGGGN